MGGYSLSIKTTAAKELQTVADKETLNKLIERIRTLAINPRPQGSEKLAGRPGLYRVRQGSYRVIYAIDDEARVVEVVKVGHRRDVYRYGYG